MPKTTAGAASLDVFGSLPHLSEAPITPFGSAPTLKNTTRPRSSKAPITPFGSAPALKSTASTMIPPHSPKAPITPFGSAPPSKSTASTMIPPHSPKAPITPFDSNTFWSYPYSSANPFGSTHSKAPITPFGSAPTSKSTASTRVPPHSSKAPITPFGSNTFGSSPYSSANPFGSTPKITASKQAKHRNPYIAEEKDNKSVRVFYEHVAGKVFERDLEMLEQVLGIWAWELIGRSIISETAQLQLGKLKKDIDRIIKDHT